MNILIEKIKEELAKHDGISLYYADEFENGVTHGRSDLAQDISKIIDDHYGPKQFVLRTKHDAYVAFVSKEQIAFSEDSEEFLYFTKDEAFGVMDCFPNITLEAINKDFI